MFKVSSILMDTTTQSHLPMTDCSVNDTLVKVVPFLKQSHFQMINVTEPATVVVHSLLQNVPYRSRRSTGEAIDQFFIGNLVIIFWHHIRS